MIQLAPETSIWPKPRSVMFASAKTVQPIPVESRMRTNAIDFVPSVAFERIDVPLRGIVLVGEGQRCHRPASSTLRRIATEPHRLRQTAAKKMQGSTRPAVGGKRSAGSTRSAPDKPRRKKTRRKPPLERRRQIGPLPTITRAQCYLTVARRQITRRIQFFSFL